MVDRRKLRLANSVRLERGGDITNTPQFTLALREFAPTAAGLGLTTEQAKQALVSIGMQYGMKELSKAALSRVSADVLRQHASGMLRSALIGKAAAYLGPAGSLISLAGSFGGHKRPKVVRKSEASASPWCEIEAPPVETVRAIQVYTPPPPKPIKLVVRLVKRGEAGSDTSTPLVTFTVDVSTVSGDTSLPVRVVDVLPKEIEFIEQKATPEGWTATVTTDKGGRTTCIWSSPYGLPADTTGRIAFTCRVRADGGKQ